MSKQVISVFGLGSMGFGVACSALAAGHHVYGFDVNPDSQSKFIAKGGDQAVVADAGAQSDVVVSVVLNGAQTVDILFGDNGIVPHMRPGSVVVSCATVAPDLARDLAARCDAFQILYLDAPISGGSVKAAEGALTMMASGSASSFDAAKPTLDAITQTVYRLGDEAGAGSAMKAVNQLLAGVHIAAMGEALTFGISQGVDAARIVEVISKCAGTSWMFENRAPHVVDGDYTPHSAVNIWLKDLGIVLDVAKGSNFSAPLAAAALQQFVAAAGQGLGREDDAAVAKVYAHNAGISLPKAK
ncbi:MAG: NAD(P)-dependent oxidoreductase [Alphaproteobacteria bacterium]|jgi:putative dehydrogenase|nr:NAD(P)-dependent oxidoreductase [Pseudomonadota bacterium]NBP47972.1 NAD(P)-dependent oxidoreductase [Alphaproteobacteria bacterium]NCW30915.1 NAD(P)-dependent oxidoreductase [Alphaproteobacteria bacterium]NDA18652.1 NAD(P)-dependent oxidoreductase [Alphaproteobacteria bacterium]NDG37011.1 NAD(P)-dependent oxidoreductase [Alphaproteobacteria bacterium]